jgi:hypothetical protein
MRYFAPVRIFAGAMAVTMAFGALSSGSAAASSLTSGPSSAQLQAALLTLAQLPALGFESQPAETAADSVNDQNLLMGCQYAALGNATPSAQAIEAFTAGGGSGPYVTEALLQYPVSVAKAEMRQFAGIVNACGSFTVYYEGVEIRVSFFPEAFPALGSTTDALRMSAVVLSDADFSLATDIVAVRRGGTVLLVVNTGDPLSPGLTRTVVQSAYAKLVKKVAAPSAASQ